MCTAALQKNLPDFMTNLDGTSVSVPGDPDYTGPGRKTGADVPLGITDSDTKSILQRREQIKEAQRQAETNPGSHIPTGVRTRKDILDEIT